MATAEQVLVVPTADLASLMPAGRRGFLHGGIERVRETVRAAGVFRERDSVETNREWKQIIPYGIVSCAGRVFLMRRLARSGERRLHDKLSIGVGGHINPPDAAGNTDLAAALEAAFEREMGEELQVETETSIRPLGRLNDDSNAVGQVHFGVVYVADVMTPEVKVRETGALQGEFVDWDAVSLQAESLETWSRLLLPAAVRALAGRKERRHDGMTE